MSYFEFSQNNSGGSFTTPAISVVIKADNAEQANAIALANGIYFDPEFEIDCDCCGNRWSEADDFFALDAIPEVDEWRKRFSKSDGVPAQIVIEQA